MIPLATKVFPHEHILHVAEKTRVKRKKTTKCNNKQRRWETDTILNVLSLDSLSEGAKYFIITNNSWHSRVVFRLCFCNWRRWGLDLSYHHSDCTYAVLDLSCALRRKVALAHNRATHWVSSERKKKRRFLGNNDLIGRWSEWKKHQDFSNTLPSCR